MFLHGLQQQQQQQSWFGEHQTFEVRNERAMLLLLPTTACRPLCWRVITTQST